MSFLKKLGEFVVEYFFMVVAGMLFVFFVGFLYATVVRPAGIFFSIFFSSWRLGGLYI
jgi:dolichyl-phosphate-mannose--protein O-mannosyl transferase